MRASNIAVARHRPPRTVQGALCVMLLAAVGTVRADGPPAVVVRLSATVAPVMCNDPARDPLPACAKPEVSQKVQPLRDVLVRSTDSATAGLDARVDSERPVLVRTLLY